jgi:hypothetical protein
VLSAILKSDQYNSPGAIVLLVLPIVSDMMAVDLSLNLDGSKVGVEIDFSSSVHCLGRFV